MRNIFSAIIVGVFAVTALLSQVSVDDAVSNLGSWWLLISPNGEVPEWLTPKLDSVVTWVCLLALAIALATSIFRRKRTDAKQRKEVVLSENIHKTPALSPSPISPEPSEYTAHEIAVEMSDQRERKYTPDQVVRMYQEKGFTVRKEVYRAYPVGLSDIERAAMDIVGSHERHTRYWISASDRKLFESGEGARISLQVAAKETYKKTKDTVLVKLWERMSGTDIGEMFANALVKDNQSLAIQVFGKDVRFNEVSELTEQDFSDGKIIDGGGTLAGFYDEKPKFTELEIKRSDFNVRMDKFVRDAERMNGDG